MSKTAVRECVICEFTKFTKISWYSENFISVKAQVAEYKKKVEHARHEKQRLNGQLVLKVYLLCHDFDTNENLYKLELSCMVQVWV